MYRKRISTYMLFAALLGFMLIANSCYYGYNDKSKRNKEFSPNMYNSIPLEPYSQDVDEDGSALNPIFANGLNAQPAPEGTVPRTAEAWYEGESYVPYHFPNTPEGYDSAGVYLTSPLDIPATNAESYNCTQETFERGKELYSIFCVMCHGTNGDGQGNLVTAGVYGNVPSYYGPTLKDLPPGKMFHTITYGKGIMGSYASQLTPRQRWEVICYIQEFQEKAVQ